MFKEKHFTYIWNSAREMVPHPCLALTWSSSVSCPEEVHVAGLMRDKGLVYFSLNYLAFILKISKDWLCSLCNHMTFAIEVHLKTEMRKSMKGAKCISVVSISEFHIRYTYLGVNPSLLQKRWEIINTSGRKKGHGNLWHEMRENPIGSQLAESRNFRWKQGLCRHYEKNQLEFFAFINRVKVHWPWKLRTKKPPFEKSLWNFSRTWLVELYAVSRAVFPLKTPSWGEFWSGPSLGKRRGVIWRESS